MPLTIAHTAPDFEAETSEGPIRFYDWLGDSWGVLFSHPKDFTPICTTELGYMAKIKPEFDQRGVKIIGLSVDSTGDHERWAVDIAQTPRTTSTWPSCTGCCRPTSRATPSRARPRITRRCGMCS